LNLDWQCDAAAEHLVCTTPDCRMLHYNMCRRCVAHSTLADTFALRARVPCEYESFGCDSGVVYHEAADHRRTCPHAPCGCPERGCGFFRPLQELLDHVSGNFGHSRPTIFIRYGQPRKVTLPLSPLWYVLVGEEGQAAAAHGADRQRDVFLVSLGERRQGQDVTTAVSMVCIRPDGGAHGLAQFSCLLTVEHLSDNTELIFKSSKMTSSSLSGGAPAPGEVRGLPVPNEYLTGDSVPLTIEINKFVHPAAPLSPTSPATAVRQAATEQSSKKRKGTNPRKLSQ
jgi:hypothetical protein